MTQTAIPAGQCRLRAGPRQILLGCLLAAAGPWGTPVVAAQVTARPAGLPSECPASLAPVADTIRAAMAEQSLPSVSIAIAQHGALVCAASFGYADEAQRRPATPDTPYSLASISKPFTATAVLQLVERGQLALDAPANEYLGLARLRAFEGDADSATVRRLLTHTAGLPLHYQFFYRGGPPAPTMDEAIARWGILVYPPGERFVYANFGFGVLDEIVARVSGVSYAEFMRNELFEPLGLEQTAVGDGSELEGVAAVRYGNDGEPVPPYTFDHVGASGVWSSALDLVRFGMLHLGQLSPAFDHVLGNEVREMMQASEAAADAPGYSRGLGWSVLEDDNGYRRISHTGSMPGVATVLNLYPEAGLAVVVLTNRSHSPSVARVSSTIASLMLPDYADELAARALAATAPPAAVAAPQAPPEPALPPELHGTWLGSVILHDDRVPVVLVVGAGDEVMVRVDDTEPVAMQNVRFAGDWLTGRVARTLVPGDATPTDARDRHALTLNLAPRDGDRLAGWVSAITVGQPLFGAVSYRVELRRVEPMP